MGAAADGVAVNKYETLTSIKGGNGGGGRGGVNSGKLYEKRFVRLEDKTHAIHSLASAITYATLVHPMWFQLIYQVRVLLQIWVRPQMVWL